MPAVIAGIVADSQVLRVAVATLAQGLDVLQRGIGMRHMFTTHPARYLAVQLAGHGLVDFVAGER